MEWIWIVFFMVSFFGIGMICGMTIQLIYLHKNKMIKAEFYPSLPTWWQKIIKDK